MKAVLPILISGALAVILYNYRQRSSKDESRETVRAKITSLKSTLPAGTTIGCPVDSNHTRIFYECRYWLAPEIILKGNVPELDTQLIISFHDDRPLRNITSFANADTLLATHSPQLDAFLLKRKP